MGAADPNRTEQEIERLRKALDAANAEFEEFVSLAAHNLRESLRDIASYSQLMAETADGLAGVYLDRIREGAANAQSLLGAVVDYWATGNGNLPPSPTDMEAVLCQALLLTDKLITEGRAIVTHEPLPAVIGDFEILVKVMHHLIRNAIEYSGTPSPRVHISCKREDLACVFSVHDDGPGIDPAFQCVVFRVFKRLHGKEYPGNGLGLAFCKKAIEWQGGRVWMESTPGNGSTFYFTAIPA
jgi:light-regulated signal transduction histidine kinase (bacteriophytochrome)